MNNPGIDLEIWDRLRKKWSDLTANGHQVRVEFKLIADRNDENRIHTIDVIQHIDGKPVTETVPRDPEEAYISLGIAGLSMERLVESSKGLMKQLHSQSKLRSNDLIVTMSSTSPTSGQLTGLFVVPGATVQTPVQIDYRYYYLLRALRDKMTEVTGDHWSQVEAVYRPDALEFFFKYQK